MRKSASDFVPDIETVRSTIALNGSIRSPLKKCHRNGYRAMQDTNRESKEIYQLPGVRLVPLQSTAQSRTRFRGRLWRFPLDYVPYTTSLMEFYLH